MSKTERAAHILGKSRVEHLLRRLKVWRGVLVLNYHRVGYRVESLYDRAGWDATPEAFDAQLAFLKRHFDIIGPPDLCDSVRPSKGRYLLITFDDGYRDNFEHAYPIARRHGVSATFFLVTGFIGSSRISWWDEIAWMVRMSPRTELSAGQWLGGPIVLDQPERDGAVRTLVSIYKSLPGERTGEFLDFLSVATGSGRWRSADGESFWMTWDMVREMHMGGMCIGGHTVNHPVLARLPREGQEDEIDGCAQQIQAETGERMRFFSYPLGLRGSFNDDTRACLRDHGVELAFSDYGGYRRFSEWDPYDVRRANVGFDTRPERFRAIVTLPQVFARW